MGKRSAGGTSSQSDSYKAKHAADTDSKTVPMRADRDANGRLTGYSVGHINTDNPGGYESNR